MNNLALIIVFIGIISIIILVAKNKEIINKIKDFKYYRYVKTVLIALFVLALRFFFL